MKPTPVASIEVADENGDMYCFDEKAEKIAAERGLVVVFPKENQLQIDLDSEEAWNEFLRRYNCFGWCEEWMYEAQSSSGYPNRHVTITHPTRTFSEYERIALQSALGSDPIREFLNMMRLENGVPNPTRLFERPIGPEDSPEHIAQLEGEIYAICPPILA